MGPFIMLDKSALQGLSPSEVDFLFKHYSVVVPNILITEIAADLKKTPNQTNLSKEKVTHLSKKLQPTDSMINADYYQICVNSLFGRRIPMAGHPILTDGVPVTTQDGRRGIFLEEPDERKTIRNWQNGIFSEEDEIRAARWREVTRAVDLVSVQQKIKEVLKDLPSIRTLRTFHQIGSYADRLLSIPEPDRQLYYITFHMNDIGVSQGAKNLVYNRWLKQGLPMFRDFSPYSCFCFKVDMMFYIGLACGLMSTKSSARIDLHYLYYLPFCMVFCSGDRLHRNWAPTLLREDQEYIPGDTLKADLHRLASEWKTLADSERRDRAYDYGAYPPQDPESITYRLWTKYMKPWKPGSGNRLIRATNEEKDELMKQMRPFIDAINRVTKNTCQPSGWLT